MADDVKRLNYFNGQFLREPDFNDEQIYHIRHQRDHARLLHTPGIAEGLDIPGPAAGATAVTVNAGVAFDDQGRRIVLADNQLWSWRTYRPTRPSTSPSPTERRRPTRPTRPALLATRAGQRRRSSKHPRPRRRIRTRSSCSPESRATVPPSARSTAVSGATPA